MHKLFLSNPTWANHYRIFQQAGFEVGTYPYFNSEKKGFDCVGLLEALRQMEEHSVVLLQVCAHNPTGLDPTLAEWQKICAVMQERSLFPFFDFAYQGFAENLVQDTAALRPFLQSGMECAVAVSHSKNFGLYAERCGALFMICKEVEAAKRVGSQIKVLIRGLYSNPPCHGARIVAKILGDSELTEIWEKEVAGMRTRISEMRQALAHGLSSGSFDFLAHQKGMFSYTGLNEGQVERLIAEYGIYMPKDGRINVAGLNHENLEYVTQAILAVSHA